MIASRRPLDYDRFASPADDTLKETFRRAISFEKSLPAQASDRRGEITMTIAPYVVGPRRRLFRVA